MQSKSSSPRNWQFSANILLPVVLALVIIAAMVLGFVMWSTADTDSRALARQTVLVKQVMSTQLETIVHDQESVAIWDDAVVNTRISPDIDWIDEKLGAWMYDFFGHDRAIVLDAADKPLYVMKDGESVPPQDYDGIEPSIAALIRRVRRKVASGGLDAFYDGKSGDAISVAEFTVVEGVPAIVSAMPIIPDSRDLAQPAGTEPLMIDIEFLDKDYSSLLASDYLFEDAAFSLTSTTDASKSVYPLVNGAGRIVAFFEWKRDRPGQLMLAQTGPALAVAFLIGGIVVFVLLKKLRSSTDALEAGRVHAEHQATHDRLTGLANRVNFDTGLARALAQREASGGHVTLMMLDLDRFKQVNDTLGHQAGDELLCAVGQRLRGIVPGDELIARLGGDEFAIVHVARQFSPDLTGLAADLITAISRPFETNRGKAHVGASIGIVNTSSGGSEPRELLRKADIALYEAKAGGRNRAVVYEEHMNEVLQLQHTIEAELREALRQDNQLSVVFQPLIDQASRRVIGAEALSRWNHPKFGHISPAKFIPVAESSGLIESLGDFVLRRACQLGALSPGRTMAVNISPTQLRNPAFAARVFDILHQTGMRPTDLEVEITESILLDEEHISSQNLRTFRASGIQIALDDFGTGYSSLSYLNRYPVDRIKIDRSFVTQLSQGHVSVAIVQAMVTLAHAMDIHVTAEGVETEEQAAILGKLGCNTFQGFLFSAAVPVDRIEAIFAEPGNALARRSKVA